MFIESKADGSIRRNVYRPRARERNWEMVPDDDDDDDEGANVAHKLHTTKENRFYLMCLYVLMRCNFVMMLCRHIHIRTTPTTLAYGAADSGKLTLKH